MPLRSTGHGKIETIDRTPRAAELALMVTTLPFAYRHKGMLLAQFFRATCVCGRRTAELCGATNEGLALRRKIWL